MRLYVKQRESALCTYFTHSPSRTLSECTHVYIHMIHTHTHTHIRTNFCLEPQGRRHIFLKFVQQHYALCIHTHNIYAYMHIYIHISAYTRTHTHKHTHTHTVTHTNTHTHTHTHTQAHTHPQTHTHTVLSFSVYAALSH